MQGGGRACVRRGLRVVGNVGLGYAGRAVRRVEWRGWWEWKVRGGGVGGGWVVGGEWGGGGGGVGVGQGVGGGGGGILKRPANVGHWGEGVDTGIGVASDLERTLSIKGRRGGATHGPRKRLD